MQITSKDSLQVDGSTVSVVTRPPRSSGSGRGHARRILKDTIEKLSKSSGLAGKSSEELCVPESAGSPEPAEKEEEREDAVVPRVEAVLPHQSCQLVPEIGDCATSAAAAAAAAASVDTAAVPLPGFFFEGQLSY